MTTSVRTSRTWAGGASGRRRKLGTGILLLLGLFAGLIGFAPSAFAHHPSLTAAVGCATSPGQYTVNTTANTWAGTGTNGLHNDIRILWGPASVSWPATKAGPSLPTGSTQGANGAFTDPSRSFSSSFTVTGNPGDVIEVIAWAVGPWVAGTGGNELRGPAGAANGTPVSLTLPGNCTNPNLDLDGAPACVAGGFNVTIDNNGTASGSATVTYTQSPGPDGDVSFTNIAAGGSQTTLIPILEGSSYTLSFGGPFIPAQADITGTRDCDHPQPGAQASLVCSTSAGPSSIDLTLSNGGTQATTADVYVKVGAGAFTKHNANPIPVPVGGTTYSVSANENTVVDVRVEFLGENAKTVDFDPFTVNCKEPNPGVGTPVCAATGMLISLTNTGQDDATFVVTSPALPGGSVEKTVAPNQAGQSVTIPLAEDATTSVTITVNGQNVYSNQSLTRDCQKPAATVTFACAAGGVVVNLTNPGTQAALVDVNGEQVNVPAGTTAGNPVTRTIAVAEGAAYSITVLGVTASGVRDCERASVSSVNLECAAGGVVVVLSNSGELPAAVTVNGSSVEVPAAVNGVDGTTSVTIPVAENASYAFDIVIDGVTTAVAGTWDCEHPAVASATLECAEGGVVVLLTNTGEVDSVVTVDGTPVNVPAGTTSEAPVAVTVPVAENATYDFTITGDDLDESFSGERNCEQPQIESVELECAEGGVVVILTNDGLSDTTVLVDGVEVVVPAGTTAENPVRVTVPVDENAEYDFTVVGDGLEQVFSGTADCLLPEASVDGEIVCAAGGLNVVLRNSGDDTATFTITSPAVPGGEDEVSVDADDEETYFIALGEDASTELLVTSGDAVLYDADLVRNCETVEGEVIVPPAPLPRTGSNTTGLLGLAGALLLAGVALVTGGRRREARLLS